MTCCLGPNVSKGKKPQERCLVVSATERSPVVNSEEEARPGEDEVGLANSSSGMMIGIPCSSPVPG